MLHFTPDINYVIILNGITWKDSIIPLFNPLETNEKLYFTILNYILDYILHPKIWLLFKITMELTMVSKM